MGGFLRREAGGSSLQESPMRLTLFFVFYCVWEEVGGGGLFGVAESNIKPLHIAYFIFVVVHIGSFFSILRRMPTFIAY